MVRSQGREASEVPAERPILPPRSSRSRVLSGLPAGTERSRELAPVAAELVRIRVSSALESHDYRCSKRSPRGGRNPPLPTRSCHKNAGQTADFAPRSNCRNPEALRQFWRLTKIGNYTKEF